MRLHISPNSPENCKLYTKASAKANPPRAEKGVGRGRKSVTGLTAAACGWFHRAEFLGIILARSGVFELFPSPFPGSRITGGDGQRGLRYRHALGQRHRAAYDHEEIVGVGYFVRHHELEMHTEELPAEGMIVLGLDDLAEAHRHDGRISACGACVDAVRG